MLTYSHAPRLTPCGSSLLCAPLLCQGNFSATMRTALTHIQVTSHLDDASLAALSPAASEPATPSSSKAGAAAAATTAEATKTFVKRSPSSMCASVANVVELCEHFLGSRFSKYFGALKRGGRCTCAAGGGANHSGSLSHTMSHTWRMASGGTAATAYGTHAAAGAANKAHEGTHEGGVSSLGAGMLELNELMTLGGGETSDGLLEADSEAGGGGGTEAAATPPKSDASSSPSLDHAPRPLSIALVGTHHKTGTVLMGQVLRTATHKLDQWLGDLREAEAARARNSSSSSSSSAAATASLAAVPLVRRNWSQCVAHANRGERAICLMEHAKWSDLGSALRLGVRLVHLIRDPVETCVSVST